MTKADIGVVPMDCHGSASDVRANCYTTASHSFISSHYHSTKQPDHARVPRRQDEHPLYISYP